MAQTGRKLTKRKWQIYKTKQYHAKKKNIVFKLRFKDLYFPTHCPVLGIKLDYWVHGKVTMNSPSFERLDSNIGYIKSNVLIVSMKANTMKNSASLKELKSLVVFLEKIKGEESA